MISVMLNTSVTNLLFEINSIKFKNEFATIYVCSFPSKISKKYGRSARGMCTCDYRPY